MIHIKLTVPKLCLLLWYLASFFNNLHKIGRGSVGCFQKLAEKNDASQVSSANKKILHKKDNLTKKPRITLDRIQNIFMSTDATEAIVESEQLIV